MDLRQALPHELLPKSYIKSAGRCLLKAAGALFVSAIVGFASAHVSADYERARSSTERKNTKTPMTNFCPQQKPAMHLLNS